mmetsp:Transcript_33177/g.75075  ORF Transcript_33177/g.75075 Transcript_33177/m.75075 type:complete len:445 (-) Transcript_33177:27-1361(-)
MPTMPQTLPMLVNLHSSAPGSPDAQSICTPRLKDRRDAPATKVRPNSRPVRFDGTLPSRGRRPDLSSDVARSDARYATMHDPVHEKAYRLAFQVDPPSVTPRELSGSNTTAAVDIWSVPARTAKRVSLVTGSRKPRPTTVSHVLLGPYAMPTARHQERNMSMTFAATHHATPTRSSVPLRSPGRDRHPRHPAETTPRTPHQCPRRTTEKPGGTANASLMTAADMSVLPPTVAEEFRGRRLGRRKLGRRRARERRASESLWRGKGERDRRRGRREDSRSGSDSTGSPRRLSRVVKTVDIFLLALSSFFSLSFVSLFPLTFCSPLHSSPFRPTADPSRTEARPRPPRGPTASARFGIVAAPSSTSFLPRRLGLSVSLLVAEVQGVKFPLASFWTRKKGAGGEGAQTGTRTCPRRKSSSRFVLSSLLSISSSPSLASQRHSHTVVLE